MLTVIESRKYDLRLVLGFKLLNSILSHAAIYISQVFRKSRFWENGTYGEVAPL